MKKIYPLLFAAVPLFGVGIMTSVISPASEVKADETAERTFTGGRKKLTGRYSTSAKDEEEYKDQLSYMFNTMNVGNIWDTNRGENVTVAVIDTGVNIYHEDFLKPEAQGVKITSSNVEEYSILNPKSCKIHDTKDGTSTDDVVTEVGILKCLDTDTYDSDYKEYYSHGTCTASCVGAAINGVGGNGIAPNVDLLIINCDLYDSSIDVAIRYATDNGADVISMSFGGYDSTDYPESEADYAYDDCATSMQDAINYAYAHDVVCVASAGNENQGSHHSYPACNKHVIGVGALAEKSATEISDYSCWNVVTNGVIDENNNADVFAPGTVWTAGVDDKANSQDTYMSTDGTSFSCPLTAGAIALYRSAYPNATADEVEQALFATCYDLGTAGRDKTYGYGRVDVTNFLTNEDINSTTVSPASATLYMDADGTIHTQQLSVSFDPASCDNEFQNGTWISSNEDVATVDQNGLVTPVSSGTAYIGFVPGQGTRYSEAVITVVDNQIHAVESISLNKTATNVGIGSTTQLSVVWNPKNATNKTVTWSTSDPSIATVNNGVVTGVKEGSAVITATSEDGNKTASCTVTVVDTQTAKIGFEGNGDGDENIAKTATELMDCLSSDSDLSIIKDISDVSKVYIGEAGWKLGSSKGSGEFTINFKETLNIKSIKINVGKYGKDTGTIGIDVGSNVYGTATPSEGEITITKNSSGSSITIYTSSKRAYIYDLEITYQLGDGGGSGSDTVAVTGVTLNKTSATLNVGDSTALTATVSPSNATNKNVAWSSSNSSVAIVNNGVVTAVAKGTAIITVTTADGNKTASCVVTVNENGGGSGSDTVAVTGVTLTKNATTLTIGNVETLTATVSPSNATNKNIIWSSSDSSVAIVDNGVILATGKGTAVITVTTVDGGKTASCVVTVTENGGTTPVTDVKVTSITVPESLTLSINTFQKVEITVGPENATNKDVVWTTSDASVAEVVSGRIFAYKEGTATITVIAADGSGVSATIAVTVTSSNSSGSKGNITIAGCSGSVIATSAILSTLSLVGAALLVVRRKKEK